ncbi:MAG: HAMP domain-containing protein [Planctomycetaceae bacterium]|nr:HAMP domain-containing protein [Planctomycetales bacterium]MCB9926296.1 HAMP domain-containing protein [Planctomycetaceae bacterium]
MTLSTRLLAFFLAMLGVVLIGFSTALYLLAENYLHRQVNDRLETVLHTVSGAIETGTDGVEWEPVERQQNLRPLTFDDEVAWIVADGKGQIVARSNGSMTDSFLYDPATSRHLDEPQHDDSRWSTATWKAGQCWIHSNEHNAKQSHASQQDDGTFYNSLSITAGVTLRPMRETLKRLAYVLIALSLTIWVSVFFVGRYVCYRALSPVRRMALATSEINIDDLSVRLPIPKSKDELEELSRAFNKMLDRLQLSFEQQRRFTGDASHQLRTPLTAILGQVDVALRRERTADEYQRTLTTVHERATHLAQMVEALLFLARADADSQMPVSETFDLATWMPIHLETWNQHPRFKDIKVESPASQRLDVLVQPILLGELLDILLDNACKFSEPGTPINLQCGQSHQQNWMTVEDQGCGIDAAEIGDVFKPFSRTSESRRRGVDGVGLGLSIAKRLAERFGGDLMVETERQHGCCFKLSFPTTNSHDGDALKSKWIETIKDSTA